MTGVKIRVAGLVVVGCWFAACGSSYRVEPLSLEKQPQVKQVLWSYGDKEKLEFAEDVLVTFSRAYDGGRCDEAWGMLTTRYRQRFADAAGGPGEAREMFCSGHRIHQEKIEQCDWSRFIAGPKPHYVTSPPPEMKVRPGPGEQLFYVVQRDGTYTSFLLVKEEGGRRLEPF